MYKTASRFQRDRLSHRAIFLGAKTGKMHRKKRFEFIIPDTVIPETKIKLQDLKKVILKKKSEILSNK